MFMWNKYFVVALELRKVQFFKVSKMVQKEDKILKVNW